jgi:ankyrin repeat protein
MKQLLTTIALTIASLLATTAFADPIHVQAASGNLAGVQAELDKGADVNAKDRWGGTPLHYAAEEGHKEIAELLIAAGADVNERWAGTTPLHYAAFYGQNEIAELLIAKGADVNAKDEYGYTPLHDAVDEGHKEVVGLLIAEGADVNAKGEDGETPLDWAEWVHDWHSPEDKAAKKEITALLRKHGGKTGAEISIHKAAEIGNIEAIKDHLEAGVNVNARDRYGQTPLDAAEQVDKNASPEIIAAKKEIAKLLRENGAMTREELFAIGWKLTAAAGAGDIEVVKKHLAAGADVNIYFPLGAAALTGHIHIVELLIREGANVNKHQNFGGAGSTALLNAASGGYVEIIAMLIDAGADVNGVNAPLWTPLHKAAQNGHKVVAEFLIANGADVSARDWYGETPLDFTESANHFDYAENAWLKDSPEIKSVKKEIANIILENGGKSGAEFSIDVAIKFGNIKAIKQHLTERAELSAKEKNNFLRYAAYWGRREVAELFIAKGAKVNAKNDDGETSLHQAAKGGSKEVAEMLIFEGAKVNHKDIHGFTPLHEAAYWGKTDVAELLIAKGADVSAKSKAGHTPLFWAISNHNKEIDELIRKHKKMPLKPRLEYRKGQLAIDGKVGREYEVFFSADLKEWQVLETLRLEASPQVYVDEQAADQPMRFYQLRLVD